MEFQDVDLSVSNNRPCKIQALYMCTVFSMVLHASPFLFFHNVCMYISTHLVYVSVARLCLHVSECDFNQQFCFHVVPFVCACLPFVTVTPHRVLCM